MLPDLCGSLVKFVLRMQKEAVYHLLIVLVVIVFWVGKSFYINIQRIAITIQRATSA